MPSPIKMRTDYSAPQLRVLAKNAKTNSQSRRLLSLAAVLDGMNRTDAARIGGMDRQTLRDWVHRFNQLGPDGLCDVHAGGVEPRLSAVIKERFGVDYHERYVGTLLRKLGFSHISPRPLHPGQDAQMLETFKKTSPSR
jgi:transposase